jgi:hypothetical protein
MSMRSGFAMSTFTRLSMLILTGLAVIIFTGLSMLILTGYTMLLPIGKASATANSDVNPPLFDPDTHSTPLLDSATHSDPRTERIVRISIDPAMWKRWGFRYPVTYIFDLPSVPPDAMLLRQDEASGQWTALEKMTSNDFFNGIECVRVDRDAKKAYVSVGFHESNEIILKFVNTGEVSFDSVTKYYDDRRAAYTLSVDNWGRIASANPGAPWKGMENNESDKYQATLHACRLYDIPCSMGINSALEGGLEMWDRMREELGWLGYGRNSWEPAVHTRTHPWNHDLYMIHGYEWEIIGCRDDILDNLIHHIPYGDFVFEFILPAGFYNSILENTSAGEFLFLRAYSDGHHPESTEYALWNTAGYHYYGIGGVHTIDYDMIFCARSPKGRYYTADVDYLNNTFDTAYNGGGIFYAILHSEYYENSVIFDTREGVNGISGGCNPKKWYLFHDIVTSYAALR